jgi:peptide/nickel transport system ATP-binding protein
MTVLEIDRLSTGFDTADGTLVVVDQVSLTIEAGETLGLVGESGCGKSVTAFSVLRLIVPPGRILGGEVRFRGRNLMALTEPEMRRVRGADIALVFQDPMTALNPVFTVGDQVAEALVVHGRADWAGARRQAVELLEAVRIPEPGLRARDYPHQLSGGQRQRVMIAMALACSPALLIADEPTTALDVTIQAEILDLLRELKRQYGLALLLITHDLGVVAGMADRVAVMYAGRIVEEAPVAVLFRSPAHPYTRGLLASIPRALGARRLHAVEGVVPSPGDLPPGCAFEPRCPERLETCRAAVPPLVPLGEGHQARCVLYSGGRG